RARPAARARQAVSRARQYRRRNDPRSRRDPPVRLGTRRRHHPRLRHRRLRGARRGIAPQPDRPPGERHARWRGPRHKLARGRPCRHDRARRACLRGHIRSRASRRSRPMTPVEIVTFGCRLNAFESDVIRRLTAEAGLRDAVIVNTCAVTAEAERQARQAIRRARREHPNARIVVTGCAATLTPGRYAALPEVDLVLDNTAKLRPESYADERLAPTRPLRGLPPPLAREGFRSRADETLPRKGGRKGPAAQLREGGGLTRERVRARAYLQVQQGCDHCCTFCIIPYARGPSRSVPLDQIIADARALLAQGYREIVPTGVDLTAYGADLPIRQTLGQMLRQLLAALPELPRLRLSSLDPSEIDDDLWHALADEPRLMPHLHLSLQSGDDLILKRMKRRHSRAQAIAVA